jgi:hypothetical protein
VTAIRTAHQAGDRAAIPREMVDAINPVGDQALVTATIAAYRQAAADVPVVFPLTWGTTGHDTPGPTLQPAITPAAPETTCT